MRLLVQPSGRSLTFEPGENLLDALLQAGVPISHSCMAGRCGTCRCRVVSGFSSPEAPVIAGTDDHVLACQTHLYADCEIEISEPDEIVNHPARVLKGRVEAIGVPAEDVRIIRVRTNKPLEFSPGQYAFVQFAKGLERAYSMASIASDDFLEFHIRIVPDGEVSGFVAEALRIGDTIRVTGPLGTSYLRRKHEGPIICVGGGTGLAPVLSIVRGSLEAGGREPIHLYFGARTEADVYAADTLAQLQAEYPNLHCHIVVSMGNVVAGHRSGLLTDAIAADWPDPTCLEGFRAYVCGAPPMVEAVSTELVARGLEQAWVYADAFFTPQKMQIQPA